MKTIDESGFLLYNVRIMENTKTGVAYMEITKETTMGQMLEYDMGIAYILMQCGMHCVGCPSSIGETLEEACAVHGIDPDAVMSEIESYLASREQ